MFSIALLFLFYIFIDVESAVSLPTKAEICENPIIDAGLALSHSKDDSIIKRYLFYGPYLLPYIREENRQEIDWQQITLINETFLGAPIALSSVGIAFQYTDKSTDEQLIHIRLRGNKNYYVFVRNGSHFNYKTSIRHTKLFYQSIFWRMKTQFDFNDLEDQAFIFIDSSSDWILNVNKANFDKEILSYEQGQIEYFVYNCFKNTRCKLEAEVLPNTIIFTNNRGNRIKIPTQFDGYYQTKYSELVFFKGKAACLLMPNTETLPREAEYCRILVNTGTIIGCQSNVNSFAANSDGPEIDPNEPDDVHTEF